MSLLRLFKTIGLALALAFVNQASLVGQTDSNRIYFPVLLVTGDQDGLYFKVWEPDRTLQAGGGQWMKNPDLLLLNSMQLYRQLEFTELQTRQFQQMIDRLKTKATDFGKFSYDDIQNPEFNQKIKKYSRQILSEFSADFDSILLPHQTRLLSQFGFQRKVRQKSIFELITTQPLSKELELSKKQITDLTKRQTRLEKKFGKLRKRMSAEFRTRQLSGLSEEAIKNLRQLLGDSFFDGERLFRTTRDGEETDKELGIASLDLVEGDVLVKPRRILLNSSPAMYHPFDYLSVKRIQRQIKLSEQQMKSIRSHYLSLQREMQKRFDDERPQEAVAFKRFVSSLGKQTHQESIKRISKILDKQQKNDLNRCYHQMIVDRKSLIYFLQVRKIREQVKLSEQELSQLRKNDSMSQKFRDRLETTEREYRTELTAKLSATQRHKLRLIFGEEFFADKQTR